MTPRDDIDFSDDYSSDSIESGLEEIITESRAFIEARGYAVIYGAYHLLSVEKSVHADLNSGLGQHRGLLPGPRPQLLRLRLFRLRY